METQSAVDGMSVSPEYSYVEIESPTRRHEEAGSLERDQSVPEGGALMSGVSALT